MGYTFITMQGFDLIASVGGEVENPEHTIPRAMFYSLLVTLLIYLPLLFILIAIGTPEGTSITELSRRNTDVLVAVAVRQFLGMPGYWLVIVAAVLSMLSALYVNLLAASRIVSSMSEDRTLPEYFGKIRERSGVPARAVVGASVILVLLLLLLPDLETAGAAASLIFLISFALTHGASILFRTRAKERGRAYRSPFFPVVPVTGGGLCLGLAFFQGVDAPVAGLIVLAWLSLGFLYFSIHLSLRAHVTDAREEVMDTSLVELRGRMPLVLVPVVNPYNVRSMVELGDLLAHPRVGRVLLLSVISPSGRQENDDALRDTEKLLSEGLKKTLEAKARPRLLVTISEDPWREILRVADEYNCESVLMGMDSFEEQKHVNKYSSLLLDLTCDIILLKARTGWNLSKVKNILVPVAGDSGHDTLRARLLSSLCRRNERNVRYVRVVPEQTSDGECDRIQSWLRQRASDETPIDPETRIIRSDDPTASLVREAGKNDLVILGVNRSKKGRLVGDVGMKLGGGRTWSTILINHSR